jgi:hypothetical protein
MKTSFRIASVSVLLAGVLMAIHFSRANAASPASDNVTFTVTAVGKKDTTPPPIKQPDVVLTLGKERKQIAGWDKPDKQFLAVVIDDSLDPGVAIQWNDMKAFLTALPDTTYEFVGYARDGAVTVAQDFTNDHERAAKALRIPLGTFGAYGSPYLSLIDLLKRWPATGPCRSILLISSGFDYFRGGGFGTANPDVDSLVERAQKQNTNVWSIYSPGVGHRSRGYFRLNYAQYNLSELAEYTGAESYYLGLSAPVAFKPYLDEILTHLANQYLLSFAAGGAGGKKGKFERVRLNTEVENVEFMHANQAFLPPAAQ